MPRVLFVCHGNICRSPMAMYVLRRRAAEAGVELEVASVGITDDEHNGPLDPRARRTLLAADYDVDGLDRGVPHRAKLVDADDLRDSFVVAMEESHRRALARVAPDVEVHLLTDFDPEATPGEPVVDPWYGDEAGFGDTLAQLERATPALLAAVRAAG